MVTFSQRRIQGWGFDRIDPALQNLDFVIFLLLSIDRPNPAKADQPAHLSQLGGKTWPHERANLIWCPRAANFFLAHRRWQIGAPSLEWLANGLTHLTSAHIFSFSVCFSVWFFGFGFPFRFFFQIYFFFTFLFLHFLSLFLFL